jgi:hypothetical protein
MKKSICKYNDIEIFKDGEQYSLVYDGGGFAIIMKGILISEEDAIRAQKSEDEACQVIIKYQNIEVFGEESSS